MVQNRVIIKRGTENVSIQIQTFKNIIAIQAICPNIQSVSLYVNRGKYFMYHTTGHFKKKIQQNYLILFKIGIDIIEK